MPVSISTLWALGFSYSSQSLSDGTSCLKIRRSTSSFGFRSRFLYLGGANPRALWKCPSKRPFVSLWRVLTSSDTFLKSKSWSASSPTSIYSTWLLWNSFCSWRRSTRFLSIYPSVSVWNILIFSIIYSNSRQRGAWTRCIHDVRHYHYVLRMYVRPRVRRYRRPYIVA